MIIINRTLSSLDVLCTVIFGLLCSHISDCLANVRSWNAVILIGIHTILRWIHVSSNTSPCTDFTMDSSWSHGFKKISFHTGFAMDLNWSYRFENISLCRFHNGFKFAASTSRKLLVWAILHTFQTAKFYQNYANLPAPLLTVCLKHKTQTRDTSAIWLIKWK